MNNPRFTLTWISAALLLPLAAQATAQITSSSLASSAISYTDIADTFTGSTYSQIVPKPAINNAGQVAFSVLARSNIQYMYVTSVLGSSFINVADTAHGYTGISYFTLNNAGTVVFDATSSTGPNANQYGIFSGNGGAVSTVADSTTTAHPYYNGGTPRISDTGSTVFIGTNPSSGQQSVVRKSGTFSTVATYNGGQFEYLYDAAINNSGQVGFITDDYSTGNNNGAFVYRANAGGAPVQIARAVTSTSVAINNAGVMTFEAAAAVGNGFSSTGLVTSDGVHTTFIAHAGQFMPGTSLLVDGFGGGKSINSTGQVAMLASDYSRSTYGIYVGDGTATRTIVRPGQQMFGKTVRDFSIGNNAINDAGQVTFTALFDDNTSAVVLSSGVNAVPEPASASLLVAGGLGLLMWRRRTVGRAAVHREPTA